MFYNFYRKEKKKYGRVVKSVDTRDLKSRAYKKACEFKSRLAYQYGWIAQLAEQRTENPCVPGSIPGPATIKIITQIRNSKSVSKSVSIRLDLGFV